MACTVCNVALCNILRRDNKACFELFHEIEEMNNPDETNHSPVRVKWQHIINLSRHQEEEILMMIQILEQVHKGFLFVSCLCFILLNNTTIAVLFCYSSSCFFFLLYLL